MIRILHTIDTTGPGGAETVFIQLIKGLDRHKYYSIAAITGEGWVSDELKKIGINPIYINSKGSFNYGYLFNLVRIIRKYKINIVQSHLLGSNLYCSLAGLICGVPVVSTFHGYADIDTKKRLTAIKQNIINYGSSKIVFVSEGLKSLFIQKYNYSVDKVITIYNGIDTAKYGSEKDASIRRELHFELHDIVVGAVGNIRLSKGYKYLLKAARLVINRDPRFRFVVFGEGAGQLHEELISLRGKLLLEEKFVFYGFCGDVPKAMNNLDIFVLPSIDEGFSISTIEAMSSGLPVVATRSGGPQEIIDDRNNGILVDACSTEQMAEAILALSSDMKLKQKITLKAKCDVEKLYSDGIMIEKYGKLYDQILINNEK